MKRVYLIRHGLPEFPTESRMCLGTTDLPLGAEGLAQAKLLAASLPPVSAVFSSPLTRALQTAQALSETVTVLDGLRELHYGQWDGLSFSQIRREYPAVYAARSADLTLPPPGAEANEAGLSRFCAAMAQAAQESPGDFAVVAHGGIMALFLQAVTGSWYKADYCEVIPLFWDHCRFFQQEVSK